MNRTKLDDLTIVLTAEATAFRGHLENATDILNATRESASRLDAMEAPLTELGIRAKKAAAGKPVVKKSRSLHPMRSDDDASWDRVCLDAKMQHRRLGIEPEQVNINNLLEPEAVDRLEKRFNSNFEMRIRLDCYDVAVAIAAGLVAAAADIFFVRIPVELTYEKKFRQAGSPLTKLLREVKFPTSSQKWLEKHFKASFDAVKVEAQIPGFGGRTHRLQTWGHDPLLGLLIGTFDIMRGGLSAIGKDGTLVYIPGRAIPIQNPLEALFIELGHLLSDGFTKMGLPAPGWTLLQTFQFGSFGKKQRTVSDLSRYMYLKGYDSRHFLTMTTSVAAAEIILRSYFVMRRRLDPEYEKRVCIESAYRGDVSRHVRFSIMATIAHGVACGCNVGKIAILGGNPLALNYAQWLRFVQSLIVWQQITLQRPTSALGRSIEAQLAYLEESWPIELIDDNFPMLMADVI